MGKLAYSSDNVAGLIEDIGIPRIKRLDSGLRLNAINIRELAYSIQLSGLLQPIVVRIIGDDFEIVAGSRRLEACRLLGWRKIPCHVVELDDKAAFEVGLIENIQRQTLNPIEEALAFRKYVNDFGWGGVSQLAEKLAKSPSYVTKRIRLLDLPSEIQDSIADCTMSAGIAEELNSLKDNSKQSELAKLISERHLTIQKTRTILKELSIDDSIDKIHKVPDEVGRIQRSFDKSIVTLKIAISGLAMIIDNIEDNWMIYELLMQHRNILHQQIDILIKERKKCSGS
jgi:ParB family chromosome partitioning protein